MLSSGQDFDKNFLDSKPILKVYLKLSRKNPDFGFLPLPSEPVWLKNLYLRPYCLNKIKIIGTLCNIGPSIISHASIRRTSSVAACCSNDEKKIFQESSSQPSIKNETPNDQRNQKKLNVLSPGDIRGVVSLFVVCGLLFC